jgi:translation initiation factor 3 subunit L
MSRKYESGGEDNSEWVTQSSKKSSWYDEDAKQKREKQQQQQKKENLSDESIHDSHIIPDAVKDYLANFRSLLSSQSENDEYRIEELFEYYDNQFSTLSERFYQLVPWPAANLVAPLVDNDELFLALYKQITTRHTVTNHATKVTTKLRIQSFNNYIWFFERVMNEEVNFDLPSQWLWDIIDEFIYSFQTFCQFRNKRLSQQSSDQPINSDEQELFKTDKVWSIRRVVGILEELINKSQIRSALQSREQLATTGSKHLLQTLGYFALIGLLRVNSLIGDYYGGLQAVDCIDDMYRVEGSIHHRVPASHITLFYYVGYAYLVMRRYTDAVRCLSSILVYLNRNKQIYGRSYQYDNIVKLSEQCYALLAIAFTLYPQRVELSVRLTLRDMYAEKMRRMQRSLLSSSVSNNEVFAVIEELLKFACPKFITPTFVPGVDPVKNQIRVFINEVKQQRLCPNIKSYLKLYTTIPVSKLAGQFLETDTDAFRQYLCCLKHKSRQVTRVEDSETADTITGGGPLSGDLVNASDVDFYVDKDMLHIADFKPYKHYGEWFIFNIHKFELIIQNLEAQS